MAPLPPRDQRYLWPRYQDEFETYWLGSERLVPDKGDLSDYWVEISSGRDFLRGAPSYTYIKDLVRRLMDRWAANVPYLLAQYLFRHAERRKSGAMLSGVPLIDMGKLVKLKICMEIGDDWAWVALGPERQHVVVAGAPGAANDAHAVDEGVHVDPAPIQAPQQPPPPPLTMGTYGEIDDQLGEILHMDDYMYNTAHRG
ncbi:hypothetical protein Tco_0842559 [Tanacetum coccineum]|uniref:Uncharacterized protein n=1 Tax=Tanacetum coccineum TaxID=301880 RepID=A0ABQ5B341_9ASTR